MYITLFYDEVYPLRNQYILLDTDKEISELGDFIKDYIEEYTQLISPIKYGTFPTWNMWHNMFTNLPCWYIDHNFKQEENMDAIINFTFYQPPIIDDGGDTYYLGLFQNCHKSVWSMILFKTTKNNIVDLAKTKCEELYDFKITKCDRQIFYGEDNFYARFIKFRLNPVVI